MDCPICKENGIDMTLKILTTNRYKCKSNNNSHIFRLVLNVLGVGGNCKLIKLEPDGCDSKEEWPVGCPKEDER